MILLRTIRKQVKPPKCKFNDPFIFPDNLLNTPFKTQLDDTIDQQFDKLSNNPTIGDYYGIADEIKEMTKKHSKLTYYKEQAEIEELQGDINTSDNPIDIQIATQKIREMIEIREK